MLNEQRNLFIQNAEFIDNWKKLSKNDLANMYVENEHTQIAESAFSGLLIKFWNLIPHFYYKRGINTISPEDCYDWVVEGISNALRRRIWLNPKNSLYNDPKGPEKAIMVCIMSVRANFYQAINYNKRILSYNSLSLSGLEEDSSDGYFLKYTDNYSFLDDYINSLIKDLYMKKEYLSAFFIHLLFNGYITDSNLRISSDYISSKYIIRLFNSIEDHYKVVFADTYRLKLEDVKRNFNSIKSQPSYMLQYNISKLISVLSTDEYLYTLLKYNF